MRLIGSKTEAEFRKELVASHRALFEDEDKTSLLDSLRRHCPELRTAYVIGWIPEQGEDIYTVLVNGEVILKVELERANCEAEAQVERLGLSQFREGLSKLDQIQLAVALDLSR